MFITYKKRAQFKYERELFKLAIQKCKTPAGVFPVLVWWFHAIPIRATPNFNLSSDQPE